MGRHNTGRYNQSLKQRDAVPSVYLVASLCICLATCPSLSASLCPSIYQSLYLFRETYLPMGLMGNVVDKQQQSEQQMLKRRKRNGRTGSGKWNMRATRSSIVQVEIYGKIRPNNKRCIDLYLDDKEEQKRSRRRIEIRMRMGSIGGGDLEVDEMEREKEEKEAEEQGRRRGGGTFKEKELKEIEDKSRTPDNKTWTRIKDEEQTTMNFLMDWKTNRSQLVCG